MNSAKLRRFSLLSIAFRICFLYWIYLALTAQMIINHDAIGYEALGSIIANNGWFEYFKTGPNREPFYPWLVSVAMRIENITSISYQTVQIFFQIGILFLTQLLTVKLSRKLNIRENLIAFIVLYLGFSPSIINSTFILYSEILTYPFVLLIILLSLDCFQSMRDSAAPKMLFVKTALLAGAFLSLTFIKGIFESVTPIFLLFYALILWKQKKYHKNWVIFLLTLLTVFYIPLTAYKLTNKTINGNFTLTDRGPWALYGNTARRTLAATQNDIVTALYFVPGWRFCINHRGEEACYRWSFLYSDELGARKRQELEKQNYSTEKINQELITLSRQEVRKNPFQYFVLFGIENLKSFFWEFPTMDYILYPNLIIQIYLFKPFANSLKILMPLLTFLGVLYAIFFLIKNRLKDDTSLMLFLMLLFIGLYTFTLSFFLILPRYIFPVVPLYLILIAFMLERAVLNKLSDR